MKNLVIGIFLGAALMFSTMSLTTHAQKVSAQISSPSYTSDCGWEANQTCAPSVQYVIVMSSARLGGGAWIYQMQQPIPLNGTPGVQAVAAGGESNLSIDTMLPSPKTTTATISILAP